MNRNLKSIIAEMDKKNEYKRKSTSIRNVGTLIHVGSEDGRQELAMVLSFVPGSKVGCPHEDYIVIGTYKYSDINASILTNSDSKPPILLIVAKVTGKNSYKLLRKDQLELMEKVRKVAGQDKSVRSRCDDLYKFELIQCMSSEMAYTYTMNQGDGSKSAEVPASDMRVDLSGPSSIEANSVAIVEDQDGRYDTTSMKDDEDIQAVLRGEVS